MTAPTWEPTWGPSVGHTSSCTVAYCKCPKRFYCGPCDAQHLPRDCKRTVLDDMVEAFAFGEKTLKKLINEIIDAAEARIPINYDVERHIRGRIDELVERHGNLGMTRKKLGNMAIKEMRRRQRRESRRSWGCSVH